MKQYFVDVDITVSKRIYVDANSCYEAKTKALEMVNKEPFHYVNQADAFVGCEEVDTYYEE